MERHRHNLPEWLVQPLKDQMGTASGPWWKVSTKVPDWICVSTRSRPSARCAKGIGTGRHQGGQHAIFALGIADCRQTCAEQVEAFVRGEFEVQDEGSQLLAMLLDAKRGEMVVDFCAGAGGKTLAIGAAMRSTGRLYAFDTSAGRLDAFKSRLARSGLSNVHPAAIAHERDDRVKRLSGKIDRVLVDAPCTGMGTLRRNPDLKWRQNQQAVEEMTVKQAAILQSAARLLKPGGRLVYATCSVLPQENEAIASAFSEANGDFVPLDVGNILTGLKIEQAAELCSGGEWGKRYLRLWPHRHQTDGFFAAVWQRT
jgi:16S rRNA (cytosine967-C5)-methyltransferase